MCDKELKKVNSCRLLCETIIVLITSNRVKSLVVAFKPAIVIWSFVGSTPILLEWAKKGKWEMER